MEEAMEAAATEVATADETAAETVGEVVTAKEKVQDSQAASAYHQMGVDSVGLDRRMDLLVGLDRVMEDKTRFKMA
jgi:hypothetical protein